VAVESGVVVSSSRQQLLFDFHKPHSCGADAFSRKQFRRGCLVCHKQQGLSNLRFDGPLPFASQEFTTCMTASTPDDDLISAAYSPAMFARAAADWQQLLTEHIRTVTTGHGPVLNWADPQSAIATARNLLNQPPQNAAALSSCSPAMVQDIPGRIRDVITRMLSSGQNLHHPHYIGHQVPPSIPLAGLFDAVSAVTNQVMAIYEMGPWATAVEHALVGRLCEKAGWSPETSSGLLTHGGSLANTTALLTARNVSLPGSWETGVPGGTTLVANSDVHYCVSRSAGILGLGSSAVVRIPLDARRRMDVDQLDQTLQQLQLSGRRVMAVSACAGSTPTGAFDDLSGIAEVCRRYKVWMHVDAAHGGGLLFSRRHRRLLAGIEQADSIVWDAHKMLFVPALCTAVLYRRREHRFDTFRQDAPYLFDPSDPGMADIDMGMRTVECTKRAVGFGLWGTWAVFGEHLFEQLVDRVLLRAQQLYELLRQQPDFEVLHEPECNILAFRYLPAWLRGADRERQSALQRAVRTRLIRSGEFYIVQTTLNGLAALRTTVMNPLTTPDDLTELLQAIRRTGTAVLEEGF
jgi:L-2,4-diaminobutyrate decarboxylase